MVWCPLRRLRRRFAAAELTIPAMGKEEVRGAEDTADDLICSGAARP